MFKIIKVFRKFFKKVPRPLRSKKALIILAAALAVLFVLTRGGAKKAEIKTVEVQRQEIKQEITASGKISPLYESTVHSAAGGKLVWVGALEGDFVEKWQVIAVLDKERYEIALRQAQQDVVAADAELVKVYDDISKASGAESFQNKITRTAAEAKKNKAYDAMKLAERNIKDAVVAAPISGTVTKLDVNAGEEILAGSEVAKIADTSNIVFKAEVDETDIAKIQTGQTVRIILDAFPDTPIESTVFAIGKQSITTSTGATAFEVSFNLPDPDVYRLGMNGEATTLVGEVQHALTVPLEAVIDEKYVWTKQDDSFEKREIEKGISSDTDVEITKGIGEGEQVLTAGFSQINKKTLLAKLLSVFK